MSNKNMGLSDALYDYLLSVSLRESEVLRQLREETARLPQAGMQITPEQGQFMALLAKLTQAKRVLEIGVFTGYSSLAVAQVLPADGSITACDISEEWTAIARRYWALAGVSDKITLRLGPALATLDKLIVEGNAGKFDLAFIDADKENYDGYYERSLQLLRTGGLLLVDNLLWGGKVADTSVTDRDTQAIRVLNEKIHCDTRVFSSLLPVADGLGLIIKG
jgi:predicted O-methyltransferase YrrM